VVADTGLSTGGSIQAPGVLHVYLGQSSGQFQSITPTIPTLIFSDLAIADMNNDGKPDIVVAASDTGLNTQVDVLLGQGNGMFGAVLPTLLAGGIADPAPTIAVADFNGDGNRDVAYFVPGDFSGVLFGAGDGTLPTQINMSSFTPVYPGAPMAFDLNGDGRADLLFADGGSVPELISFMNGGSFSTASAGFAVSASPASGSVTAGQSATTTVTLTPTGGFTGTASLSCSGLPAGAACAFLPASITSNGSVATSTLTISTTARTAMNSGGASLDPLLPGGLLLAGFALPVLWRRRRDLASLGSNGLPILLVLIATTLAGCGGGGGSSTSSASSSGSSSSSSGSSSSSSGSSASSSSSSASSSSSSGGSSSSSGASGSSGSSSSSSSSGGGSTGTPAGTYTVTITATGSSATETTTYTLTVN
jgi:hypothetical protein